MEGYEAYDKAIAMDLEVNKYSVSVEIFEIDPWDDVMEGTFEYTLTSVNGHGHALDFDEALLKKRIREALKRANRLFM